MQAEMGPQAREQGPRDDGASFGAAQSVCEATSTCAGGGATPIGAPGSDSRYAGKSGRTSFPWSLCRYTDHGQPLGPWR